MTDMRDALEAAAEAKALFDAKQEGTGPLIPNQDQPGGLGPLSEAEQAATEAKAEWDRSRGNALRASIQRNLESGDGFGLSPQETAAAFQLAADTGYDPQFIAARLKNLSLLKDVNRYDYERMVRFFPATAEQLKRIGTPVFDDLENLSTVEWLIKGGARAWQKGLAGNQLQLLNYKERNEGLTDEEKKRRRALEDFLAHDVGHESLGGELFAKGMEFTGQMADMGWEALKFGAQSAAVAGLASAQVPAFVPEAMGIGLVTGAAYKFWEQATKMQTGSDYRTFIEAGMDENTARKASAVSGAIGGSLEFLGDSVVGGVLGIGKLLKRPFQAFLRDQLKRSTVRSALAQYAKDYGKVLGAETSEEVLQDLNTMLALNIAAKFSNTDVDTLSEDQIMDSLLETLKETTKGLALFSAVPGLPRLGHNLRRASQARQNEQFFRALSETMKESKVASDIPSEMQRFVADIAKDGPVKEVYIDAREFQQVLSEQGIDPEAFGTVIPGLRKQLDEAEAVGGDITIPIDTWATKIAPTDVGIALNDVVRLHEEDMSPKEARQFMKSGALQELRDAIKEAESKQAEIMSSNAEADVVYQRVRQQLIDAGQAPEVADKQAGLYRALFRVLVEKRAGKSPIAMLDRLGLRIVTEDQINAIGEALQGTDISGIVPDEYVNRVKRYIADQGIDLGAVKSMNPDQVRNLITSALRLGNAVNAVGTHTLNAGNDLNQQGATRVAPFDTSFEHKVVPLDSIHGADQAHAPDRAVQFLTETAQGKRAPRRPPSVRLNADGTYTVLDGRSGTTAAMRLGYTHIPVRVIDEDTGHVLPDAAQQEKLDAMYDQAARDKDKFDKKVEQLAEEFGGYPLTAVLKSREKATKKIINDYDGEADRIKDILRATLIIGSAEDAAKARQRISELFDIDGGVRDLFENDHWPNGYQDMKFNVRMNGQIYELQVNTFEMIIAKEVYGHILYDLQIKAKQAANAGEITKAEYERQYDVLERAQALIYGYAKEAHRAGTPLPEYEANLHQRALDAANLARNEADFDINFTNRSRETSAPFLNAAARSYGPGGFSSIRTAPPGLAQDASTGTPSTSNSIASSGNLSGNGAGSNFGSIDNTSDRSIPQAREFDQLLASVQQDRPDSLSPAAIAYREEQEKIGAGVPVAEPFRNKDGSFRRNDKGDITGAPLGVKTETDIEAIVDRVVSYLDSPLADFDASHEWYEVSGRAIREVTQGDPQAMEQLIRLMAVLSASNQVGGNVTGAIKAVYQLSRGEIPAAGRFPNEFAKAAPAILAADQMSLDVPKVNDKVLSFYRNLWDATFLSDRFENAATMDMWMARLFGYSERDVVNADSLTQAQYRFANYLNRLVTEKVNARQRRAKKRLYKPRQIQAALWVYARNREKYGGDIGSLPVTPDRGTFETYLKRATQNITVEAIPSKASGLLPEIHNATPEQKEAYTSEAFGLLLDNQGRNELFARLGIPLGGVEPGSGSFEGAVSPNRIVRVVAEKNAGRFDRKKADLASLALMYIYTQDGVPWFQLDPTAKGATQGFAINFKSEPSVEVQEAFYEHLRRFLPEMDFTRVGNALLVVNYAGIPRKKFSQGVHDSVATYDGPGADLLDTEHLDNVKATGDYHDITDYTDKGWEDPAAAEKLEGAISEAGGRDLLPWLRDRREAVARLQADWRDRLTAGREFNQSGIGGGGLGYGRAREGAVQVRAVHYSKEARTVLDSSRFGTGKKGAERARLDRESADPAVRDRIYFYVDEGNGIRPESGVGSRAHPVTLNNLYDLGTDPLGFKKIDIADKDDWFNAVESAIHKAGFDGYYAPGAFGRQGVAVLLGEHQVPVQAEPRAPLYAQSAQKQDQVRGSIQLPDRLGDQDVLITLGKSADLSTFLHESSHLFLEIFRDLALDPNAAEDIKADWQKIKRFLGILSDDELITTNQHERWAEAFEKYLFEGKAPSEELEGLFATFRGWMIQVYKGIKEAIGITGVELNDEIRDVFDRMLASEEEIKAARVTLRLSPLFKDAKSAGMTERQYAAYLQALSEATAAAEADLIRKAVAHEKRVQREAWAAAEASLRPSVEEELKQDRVYQATRVLTGDELPEGVERIQLDRQAVKDLLEGEPDAEDVMKGLQRHGVARRSILGKQGADPELVAQMFGFDSALGMLREIAAKESYAKALKRRLNDAVREQLGDVLATGQLENEAVKSLHGDPAGRFLAIELKALARRVGQEGTPANVARAIAREIVRDKKVIDLGQVSRYLQAELRAANAATRAAAQGDFEEAARHKRTQLINHYLYAEAVKAKDKADKIQRYLAKFNKPGTRKNLARDYLDQIDAILESYDLRKSATRKEVEGRRRLREWIAEQEAQGNEVVIDEDLAENARRVSYKDLTFGELSALADSIKNIETLARLKQRLLASKERRLVDEAVEDMYETARTASSYRWHEGGIDFGKGIWHKLNDWRGEFVAEHIKPEMLFRLLDGDTHGPWWHYMFKPIADAENVEQQMIEEIVPQVQRLFDQYSARERMRWFSKKIHIDSLGISLTKDQILSVALNWGNVENRKQILEGFGWTTDQVEDILSHLTDKDWDFVQGVWDLIDQFWPDIAALEKELTGVVPRKVEADEFATPTGRRMRGGYYPLQYDPRYDQRIAEAKGKEQDLFSKENNWLRAATRHGHTKERIDHKGKPVLLDLHVFTRHIGNVIHDLAFRKAIMQVERLRSDKRVREAIVNTAGLHAYDQLRPWLQAVANDHMMLDSHLERVIGYLRKGTTIANMGLKISTAVMQPLGFTQSIDLLGEKWAGLGLAKFYANPVKAVEFIRSRSVMMRSRIKTYDRDVRDAVKRLTENSLKSRVEATYFQLIGLMDLSVSMPTWIGAYEKAVSEGASEEEAISQADSAVRLSQGSGSPKDLATIQRGSEFKRLFTMFYSFFNTLFNLLYRTGKRTRSPGDVPRAILSYFYLVAIPSVLTELLMGNGPEDDEDKLWWAVKTIGAYPAMSMVGLRDVVNGLVTPYDYQISPVASMLQTLTKGGKAIAEGNFSEYAVKNLIVGSGVILHLPTRQAYITLHELMDVANGQDLSMYELLVREERKR